MYLMIDLPSRLTTSPQISNELYRIRKPLLSGLQGWQNLAFFKSRETARLIYDVLRDLQDHEN